ncbi:class I SAM-dependent methyltransferase [Haloferula sp. BvORR071]|uniref:class I SAM-dependent methyltransferase n=1 Tax=Haloferula sp. BvORR071 TaxID=1396141 RepID=UPI00054E5678|nr:class I SAM-dependent methyltransferase [Haloferula sp. BvORR071]
MSAPERPTQRAHRELAAILCEGDLAIDATSGNGHDTLFLANQVGPSGRVIAFDIQKEAIDSTRARLTAAGVQDRVTLVHGSHASLSDHVAPGSAQAVVFNLGYLPGVDHALITLRETTLLALEQALVALSPGGLLLIVCYPGHPGGDEESAAVLDWTTELDRARYTIEVHRREDTLRPAPFLVLVRAAA